MGMGGGASNGQLLPVLIAHEASPFLPSLGLALPTALGLTPSYHPLQVLIAHEAALAATLAALELLGDVSKRFVKEKVPSPGPFTLTLNANPQPQP